MSETKCVPQKECAGPQQCEIAGECLRARFSHETAHVPNDADTLLREWLRAHDALLNCTDAGADDAFADEYAAKDAVRAYLARKP